jgi:hypothetical protein
MSFIDRSDDEFERALLRSACRDVPDAGAGERAWSRFAALMAGVATTIGVPKSVSGPTGTAGSAGRFARGVVAAKWLVVGAIGGSAVTFALVRGHAAAPAPATSVAPTSTVGLPSAVVAPRLAPAEPSGWVAPESHPKAHASPTRAFAPAPRDEASSLAAEVAALDVARSALDSGTPDDALAVLRRYLRDFPKGKLLPEAEVMGIEALAAKGDRARVTQEATRFLERYPNAPQRTRVEQLRTEAREK